MATGFEIHVRQFPLPAVIELAVMDHADRNHWVPRGQLERRFRHRIAVNWLRHRGSNYDQLVSANQKHYAEIRTAVLQEIAELYPELADECARQAGRIRSTETVPHTPQA